MIRSVTVLVQLFRPIHDDVFRLKPIMAMVTTNYASVRTSPSSTAQTNDNERSKYRSPNLYNPLGIFYYFRSEKQAVQAVSSLINEGLYEEGLLRFEKYYNSRHETTQHVRVRGELCGTLWRKNLAYFCASLAGLFCCSVAVFRLYTNYQLLFVSITDENGSKISREREAQAFAELCLAPFVISLVVLLVLTARTSFRWMKILRFFSDIFE